jgi:hypothetical protein
MYRRDLRNEAVVGAVLRPLFPSFYGPVTLQPTSWFVGNRTLKPAFGNERIEIILPKGLAVFDTNKSLDFTSLAGLLAEPENLDGDLSGDLSGRVAFTFPGHGPHRIKSAALPSPRQKFTSNGPTTARNILRQDIHFRVAHDAGGNTLDM